MSDELPFRLITGLVLGLSLTISGYFRKRADRLGGQLTDPAGRRLVLMLRLYGLAVVLPLLAYVINPEWVAWARFPLPEWVRWLAALVALGIIPVFYWILASLGNNISPTASVRQGATLVTHGPYRWVRHPLYSAGCLVYIAISLLTALWWVAIAALPALAVLVWRTSQEEVRLIEAFGDQYRGYMQRTGRFLPRLSR